MFKDHPSFLPRCPWCCCQLCLNRQQLVDQFMVNRSPPSTLRLSGWRSTPAYIRLGSSSFIILSQSIQVKHLENFNILCWISWALLIRWILDNIPVSVNHARSPDTRRIARNDNSIRASSVLRHRHPPPLSRQPPAIVPRVNNH